MGTAPVKAEASQEQELDELINELDAIQKDGDSFVYYWFWFTHFYAA